jgi:hypothetical protein
MRSNFKGGRMPAQNRQFSLALEALAELKSEEKALHPKPVPAAPTLSSVLAEMGPLPKEALFMGVASDGLPVLLNLRDPFPGPILITGDAGSGKTAILQLIAQSAARTHRPDAVQFGVISSHLEEWQSVQSSAHALGLFSPGQDAAQELLLSLASWAHANKDSHKSVLLLIDDFEAVTQMDTESIQYLRWLLLRGSSRRVWLFVTLEAGRYGKIIPWLPSFRTRLFGRITDDRVADAFGADKRSGVDRLEPRIQFALRENGNWLQFWLPSC